MNTIVTTNWDEDVQLDAAETYQALVRSLDLTEGFGIFLVRCVEGERDRLMQRLQQDLPKQQITQLRLETALEDGNLYNRVAAKLQAQPELDVLFIDGLEKSFEAYIKPGYGGQGDYYKMDSVPRVLGHLNLQRERFRNDFPVSLVFFLSPFGLKYIARRAPDFFDWRSGIFEFVADWQTVVNLSEKMRGDYDEYLQWSHQQRLDRIQKIQALLEENNQTDDTRASLAFQQGNLFVADENYLAAFSSYEQALKYDSENYKTWYNYAINLYSLGRYEEAIDSYDQALRRKQDDYEAWFDRGNSLAKLGRFEEEIASYEQALKYKPDHCKAWFNHGIALNDLGRFEAAISSYDEAVKCKPDYHSAWNNRGISFANLMQFEEAIFSYGKAVKYNPDCHNAWYNRACAHSLNRNPEAALQDLVEAIRLAPEEYRNLAKTDTDFDGMRDDPRFQALLEGELLAVN
jgi:tetratricopeptide (TPR) repeat protein